MRLILFSNYASRMVSIVLSLLVVPLYIHALGVANYGLIALFLTVQQTIMLLEGGMGGAIARRLIMARADQEPESLLKTVVSTSEILFVLTAVAIVVIWVLGVFALPHSMVSELNELLSPSLLAAMGIAVAVRFPVQCYSNVLIGCDRQVVLNVLLIAGELFRHGAGLLSVYLIAPSPYVFFASQIAAGLMTTALFRWIAIHPYNSAAGKYGFNLLELKKLIPFAGAMFGATASWAIVSSIDRPILSSSLAAYDFGIYAIAAQLGFAAHSIFYPLFNSYYPRLTHAMATKNDAATSDMLVSATTLTTAVAAAVLACFCIYGDQLVALFLAHSPESGRVAQLLLPFVVSAAAHGLWLIPYALQLSQGKVRVIVTVNIVSTVALAAFLPVIANEMGLLAAAWLAVAVFLVYGLLIGPWIVYQSTPQAFVRWAVRGVLTPIVAVATPASGIALLISGYTMQSEAILLGAAFFTCILLAISGLLVSTEGRKFLRIRQ